MQYLDSDQRPKSDYQQLAARVADAVLQSSRWGSDANESLADKLLDILIDEGVLTPVHSITPMTHRLRKPD